MLELCEYKLIISVLVIELLSTTTISVLFHSRPISKAFFDLFFVFLSNFLRPSKLSKWINSRWKNLQNSTQAPKGYSKTFPDPRLASSTFRVMTYGLCFR